MIGFSSMPLREMEYMAICGEELCDDTDAQETGKDPSRFEGHEVSKIAHYWLEASVITKSRMVQNNEEPFKSNQDSSRRQ
jgi:hypothetical protein